MQMKADAAIPNECEACDRAHLCLGRSHAERYAALERARAALAGNEHVTSVVLSSDLPIVRNALGMLIASDSRYTVAVEIANCPHALRHLAGIGVHVAVVDFDLSGSRPEFLATLKMMLSAAPRLPMLMLTEDPDCDACRSAFQSGLRGIILKSRSRHQLLEAINHVARGETWFDCSALEKVLAEKPPDKISCPEDSRIALLTRREREIVRIVARGHTNRQVGQQLFISAATVRHHLCAIFDKLGVATRSELIVYAHRHRLADGSPAEAD